MACLLNNSEANQPVHRPLTVLIADDSAAIRSILSVMISNLNNLEVVGFAQDGVEALEQIHRLKPDMVTLDLEMPGLSGIKVLEALREEDRAPEVVVFSASEEKQDEQKCLELGAKRFFNKDGDFNSLIDFLRAA